MSNNISRNDMADAVSVCEGAFPPISSPTPKKKRKRNDVESNDRGNKGRLLEYNQHIKLKNPPIKTSKVSKKTKAVKEDEGTMTSVEEGEEHPDPKDHKEIPIGVDLGCTFTGVAYALSMQCKPSDVKSTTNWPGRARANEVLVKCPTRLAYSEENPEYTKSAAYWGYEVESDMISCSNFKTLFDQSARPSADDDPLLQGVVGRVHVPRSKTVPMLGTDFLRGLYEHILNTLAEKITREMLQVSRLHFYFTVPAIWSNAAKELTLQMARDAGFTTGRGRRSKKDKLSLVTEPEAAAIATINLMTGPFQVQIVKANTSILIIDAGGLTVDLSVLRIVKLEPELKMEEAAVGIGAKCGSTAIDRQLLKLCQERYGEVFTRLPAKRKAPGSQFMNQWEVIKKEYSAQADQRKRKLCLIMNGLDEAAMRYYDDEGNILLTTQDLEKMFARSIESVLSLVEEQLQAVEKEKIPPVKTLILVGGFGASQALFNKLQEFANERRDLKLVRPDNGWAAVALGACMKGLDTNFITSFKCRKNYGISVHSPFRDGVDGAENSFDCPVAGKRATGNCKWLFRKGQKIHRSTAAFVDVSKILEKSEDRIFKFKLYSSSLDAAPNRIDDDGVELEGEILVDVTSSSLLLGDAQKVRALNSNKEYTVIPVRIKMMPGHDSGTLAVSSIVNGLRCGHTTITFAEGGPLNRDSLDP